MADRYWVGGTDSWNGTAGTKWATTSGGAGGASVPTSADDVYFDNNSGVVTVTIATGNTGAKSISCTSPSGNFAGTLTGTAAITVSGSVTLVAGMTYTYSGTLTLAGTGTIISAGKTFGAITVNGSGITVTLGDALDMGSTTLTVTQGTFTTSASNYNLTCGLLSSTNSNTRTISLNGSTVTLGSTSALNFSTSTGLTFNAGTSTIIVNQAGVAFFGGGQTFYNVSFTSTVPGATGREVRGSNTYNNLSVTGPSSANVNFITFDSNQTINGTLSTTGTAGNRRVWFRSSVYGIARTFTINGSTSLTDADFRDIYVIGTAAPISGTRVGNRGACRGITFDAPKTVYWNLSGAQNWSANGWAATSTGSPSTDNFPLPQDTATFTNAGSVTGTITLDTAIAYVPNVDMSGRTSAMTLGTSNATTVYGNWTNGSGTAFTGTAALTFSGGLTQTITSAGKTFSCDVTVDSYGGSVELADAFDNGARITTVTNGTFDTKNYNVTTGVLSSTNSNIRKITLGSSTVTISGGTPNINFTTQTGLTFEAGTSQITINGTTSAIITASNLTFYNLSFTSSTVSNVTTISGSGNVFNDLSFTAPSSAGAMNFVIGGIQTVSGTFTCAGATAIRRIFVRSDVLGTARTLTVGTLSATDCDFRDITIAGTAAGSSPTRAGDCGGNSGITFPSPKTVYWNLAGAQNWSATAWCPSSGGTPDINQFPLAQDTAVFDEAAGSVTGTITIDAAWNIGTFDASLRTSAMTLTLGGSGNLPVVYGDWKFGTGVTSSSTAGSIRFAGRGTKTITSNGVTFGCTLQIDAVTGIIQLADALALNSARSLNLVSGTFDAVTYNVTVGLCSITGSTVRTLKMGSGTWTLSGTGSVWSAATITNLGFYKNTANITLSDTSTTARTFTGGGLSYNKLTIGGTTGTSTLTIDGNNQFTELASTKTVAHTIALGSTTQTFGKWTVTGTVGNVVTLTGNGTTHVLAGACTSGIDYLAMGSIGFADTSPGEFYAGANSTGTANAPVYRTAKPADSTRYWVGGTGNWSDTARWSTGSGAGGGASVPRSHDDVVFDAASNATAYTATVNVVAGGIRCKSLTIAGPASGNLTLAGTSPIFIHNNVTLPATGLTRTYTGNINLSGSTSGRTITTNGVALSSVIFVNGVDCGWSLGSALDIGSNNIILTNGSLDLATYNLTATAVTSDNGNSRTIDFDSGTTTLSSATPIQFGTTETAAANLTVTGGTSQINLSSATAALAGNGKTFYNVSFTSTAVGSRSVTGVNTFNNLTLTASATGMSELSVNANQTVSGTLTCAGSSATARGFVRSDTIGTTRTITAATLSANDCDFRDITVSGGAAGTSPTRAGDCGGNSGVTFPATKTVYWNLSGTQNWNATGWAGTSTGSPAATNFPLSQDTATFTNSGSAGTVNFGSVAYNFPSIDASGRTSAMTLGHNGAQTLYGNYTLGSGVTVSGTSAQTFSGSGTQTFTSAGKTITFPITVDKPAGSFDLGDAFTSNSTSGVTLTRGTFDAKTYNFTAQLFSSSVTNTRTLTMGSSLWTLSGTGTTVWNTASSGLTFNKGTADILLSSTSTNSRILNPGSLVYNKLTIGGATGISTTTINENNTFSEIASTKTVAHTITLGGDQSVAAWTVTGTSGNVVTINSSSAGTTRAIIKTGGGTVSGLDYLSISDNRAYPINATWYAGANSTNGGSLGWSFSALSPVVSGSTNFFLMF